MATSVDICNLALAHLGDEASVSNISPPDGSAQAAHCARYYPIARDQLLEMHAWNFAVTRAQLAETGTAPDQWAYQYALPTNCVKVLKVFSDGVEDDTQSEDFNVETLVDGTVVIQTNAKLAWCRYVKQVTDTSKFTPTFVICLSWLLASYIAGPITKDLTKKESSYKVFQMEFGKATVANANVARMDHRKGYTPTSIKARN